MKSLHCIEEDGREEADYCLCLIIWDGLCCELYLNSSSSILVRRVSDVSHLQPEYSWWCCKVWRIQGTKELPKTWDCPATKCHICPTVIPQICSLCDADILYQSVACIMKQILFDQHYPYFETARRHVLWYLIAILTRVDFSSLQLWSPLKRLLTQTASKTIGLCQLYDNNS